MAGRCRTEVAGAGEGFPLLLKALLKCDSSGQALRALKGPPGSGSPCREDSRCCSHWTGRGGEGGPRAGALFGVEPGPAGAADGGCGPEGSGCCHSGSPRSSAAGGGHKGAARGCRSLPAASYVRTTRPTATGRAAPTERKLLNTRAEDTARELKNM